MLRFHAPLNHRDVAKTARGAEEGFGHIFSVRKPHDIPAMIVAMLSKWLYGSTNFYLRRALANQYLKQDRSRKMKVNVRGTLSGYPDCRARETAGSQGGESWRLH